MQYLVVHSVQGLLHAVTGVLSGLCQTSHTVSQRQHYPGPCSVEGHKSLVVCLQIMIIDFKLATFITESTIEGATEGTGGGVI